MNTANENNMNNSLVLIRFLLSITPTAETTVELASNQRGQKISTYPSVANSNKDFPIYWKFDLSFYYFRFHVESELLRNGGIGFIYRLIEVIKYKMVGWR